MSKKYTIAILSLLLLASACQKKEGKPATVAPVSLKDVPALRLNYRYEPDVPSPKGEAPDVKGEEKNPSVLADFDANRAGETLTMTVTSPNKERVLAVYQRTGDLASTYRLDMYGADGKMIRQVTPETMAVAFPHKIVWSPDGTTMAFAATVREMSASLSTLPAPSPTPATLNKSAKTSPGPTPSPSPATVPTATPIPTPRVGEIPPNVLTLRTEQIYTCSSEGSELKSLTQNEGKIYFHFTWSPNSNSLAALAATFHEWRFLQYQADQRSEVFEPKGRPRVVEKNGRERLLDDNLTSVYPIWSPDSTKVAVAFETQVRLYDAISETPTQAAIPLRNQLLISSAAYDQAKRNLEAANSGAVDPSASPAPTPVAPNTLPDEKDLVSFQPIIEVEWSVDDIIYFQTGFVKEFKVGEGARSSLRWHRLILSPQATKITGGK